MWGCGFKVMDSMVDSLVWYKISQINGFITLDYLKKVIPHKEGGFLV